MSINSGQSESKETPAAMIGRIESFAERGTTTCGKGRMVWRIWGKGIPLVLLHGGYGSWTHWIRNVLPLSEHFMVMAPDMPGLGESDEPPTSYTVMSLAEIIAEGIGQILPSSTRFHLAGFSFGGILSGHVAARLESRVITLTLIGAGGLGLPMSEMVELESWRSDMMPDELAAIHRHNLGVLMLADSEKVDDLAVYLHTVNIGRSRIKSRPFSRSDVLRRVLPQVKAELKGIWGERDATCGIHLSDRENLLRELCPEVDFRIIKGLGHWVAYESPRQFNEVLLDMLKSPAAVAERNGRKQ